MGTLDFQNFIRSVCVALFQQRSRRGVSFCVPQHKIVSFASAIVGRDESSSITYQDALAECITRKVSSERN